MRFHEVDECQKNIKQRRNASISFLKGIKIRNKFIRKMEYLKARKMNLVHADDKSIWKIRS